MTIGIKQLGDGSVMDNRSFIQCTFSTYQIEIVPVAVRYWIPTNVTDLWMSLIFLLFGAS